MVRWFSGKVAGNGISGLGLEKAPLLRRRNKGMNLPMTIPNPQNDHPLGDNVAIRRADQGDLERIISLDARVTGTTKQDYWQDIYERYATRRLEERFFLVADGYNDAHENFVKQ